MDEMWSYVGNKKNQCWLWWAIDHKTGNVWSRHKAVEVIKDEKVKGDERI